MNMILAYDNLLNLEVAHQACPGFSSNILCFSKSPLWKDISIAKTVLKWFLFPNPGHNVNYVQNAMLEGTSL